MTKTLDVVGIAVKSGVSKNNHLFLPEELEKAYLSLSGKPILKDHEATVSSAIGKVTKTEFAKEKEEAIINFEGFVIDDGNYLFDKIETGIISEVSIGAYAEQMVQEEDKEDGPLIPIGLHFMEVSLTPTPAVDGTQITKAKLQENNEKIIVKEETKMVEEKKETPAVVQETPKVDYKAELEKVQEELAKFKTEMAKKELDSLKEKTETKTVNTAVVKNEIDFEGYIVEKGEYGNLGIRKEMPKTDLKTLGGK
jgi:hypothetical protein